jgi:hypothetical protein
VPRKSELFSTDDVGLAAAGAVDGFVVGGSAMRAISAERMEAQLVDHGTPRPKLEDATKRKRPRASLQRGRQSPLRWGWRDFLRKRVSAVLQGPAMERQREKHPRAPRNVPKAMARVRAFCRSANRDGGRARFRRTANVPMSGIEPHNSWCNLAPLDEVL